MTYKDVEEQNDIGQGETATEAYEMLDFSLRKTFVLSNQNEISLSLFGKNLLDEVAGNHASFVKNEVPLPGRNFGMKLKRSILKIIANYHLHAWKILLHGGLLIYWVIIGIVTSSL